MFRNFDSRSFESRVSDPRAIAYVQFGSLLRSVLVVSTRRVSNRGSRVQELLLMFNSEIPCEMRLCSLLMYFIVCIIYVCICVYIYIYIHMHIHMCSIHDNGFRSLHNGGVRFAARLIRRQLRRGPQPPPIYIYICKCTYYIYIYIYIYSAASLWSEPRPPRPPPHSGAWRKVPRFPMSSTFAGTWGGCLHPPPRRRRPMTPPGQAWFWRPLVRSSVCQLFCTFVSDCFEAACLLRLLLPAARGCRFSSSRSEIVPLEVACFAASAACPCCFGRSLCLAPRGSVM